jgi:hypothetical protein
MYDESSFTVSFTEPDNVAAISIKFRNRFSCTDNSHLRSADVLQSWYSTRDQDLITTSSIHIPHTTTEVFNNNITAMGDLRIIITTPGFTMQTSCIKKAPNPAYHKTQPRAVVHTRGFLTTTTLV